MNARPNSGTILGHPKGLYVLFFTELWERFSFYGMKTLLMLYMINHFFWSQAEASSLLGTYSMLAYGLPIFGGFIADRWLGQRRAIIWGAILLSAGHICMAFEPLWCFYFALGLIIAGVGLLKPNISTQVGSLYSPGDPRRDGAFTIFYMGINLGAFIGPLLCDWLRVHYGWHFGFGAAGVGMILGLIVYVIGQRKLVEFQQDVLTEEERAEQASAAQAHPEHPPHVIRDRVIVLLVIFAFVILFWTAFEQSPNAMLVWADKHSDLRLGGGELAPVVLDENGTPAVDPSESAGGLGAAIWDWFQNLRITSGQTQSFNPFFIITLAPLFAFLWVWLDRRRAQPSTPTKMVLGLTGVVLAFGVMWPAAQLENARSSSPLGALPDGILVDEEGRVYTRSEAGDGTQPVYYGATRLQYSADERRFSMYGVLPDLDRFRLLAATAPKDLVAEVEAFAKQTAEGATGQAPAPSPSDVADLTELRAGLSARMAHAPEWLSPVTIKEGQGASRKTVLVWEPETRTLHAYGEVKERARIEFLAAAADPEFKAAVDQIYLESSTFRVSVWWLVGFYLLLTMGELCLSPVGLSLVTKLAPPRHVGLCMGGWFLATAIAEKLAQVFGAWWGRMPPATYFMIFVVMCGLGAMFLAVLVPKLKRMMHGVQ